MSKVGLFILVVFVILLLFIDTHRLNYEYKKGTPWRKETLYAPFDFPIKKSPQEIEQEKAVLLNNFVPYFTHRESVAKEKIKLINGYYKADHRVLIFLTEEITAIYEIGILNTANYPALQGKTRINIIKHNISEAKDIASLYTKESALEHFTKKLDTLEYQDKNKIKELVTLENVFEQNIVYNKSLSETKKDELIKGIIPNIGMIQVDERIVSRGELIGEKTFQVLESLNHEYSRRIKTKEGQNFTAAGQLIIIFFSILILFLFLSNYRKKVMNSGKLFFLILLLLFSFIVLTRVVSSYPQINIYCVPYIIIIIILRTFIDIRTAIFTFLVTITISSLLIGYEFLFIQLITGCVSALSLSRIQKRSQLFFIALFVFFTYSALYVALTIIQEGNIASLHYKQFTWYAINGLLLTFAYLLLYIIEKVFGFTSDITLIELSNTNNKLLRQLNKFAAGTFQHSLQVANLAEEALVSINKGNPVLVRTAALYHDIGKMKKPVFFIENQNINYNPHDNLPPPESAAIIKDHVTEGVRIAKKYNLPTEIINFILTHHGRNQIGYFLYAQKKKLPAGGAVDLNLFTYDGPDPYTIEQAVLMMADSCEAACRSLEDKTEATIKQQVESVIQKQLSDGRFRNAPINFQDIEDVKEIFKTQLLHIYHSRIIYPKPE